MAETLQRPQLSAEIAAHVRESVMSGQLRPGEFIRLDALAHQLGTSVTPVREALLLLRGEDMVRLIPRRGYVVSPLSRRDVEDLFELQAHLGAELVGRACEQFTPADLDELARLNRELLAAIRSKDAAAIERGEYQFHRAINTAAGSRKLAYLLNNASKYLPRGFYSADAQWRTAAGNDHRAILDALRARDADAARNAIAGHVLDGRERLLAHLDAIDFWG